MVGQGPAVLSAGAGRMGCFFVFLFVFFFVLFVCFLLLFFFLVFCFFCVCFYFISSILSSFSNASSLGRRPDILKYCGLGRYNLTVVVSYYWRGAR